MLYRKGVGIMLINEQKKIFAGLRNDIKNVWQMPQGGVKNNETEHDGMWRELKEETGLSIDNVKIIKESKTTLSYNLPEHLARKLWGGMYIGQCQRWFLLRFLGEENDININKGRASEFCDWRWLSKDELLSNVIDFKKNLYQNVLKEFSAFIDPK